MFQNRLSKGTNRLPEWEYTTPGGYFVTICTKLRRCYFGEVVIGKTRLNSLGEVVKEEILKAEEVRRNVIMNSWVGMPNHIYLIIGITEDNYVETPRRGVSTESTKNWQPGSLGVIINHLKEACTRRIRKSLDPDFAWQVRFYDDILRTDKDLDNLRLYIQLNPENWQPGRIDPITREISTHA